MTTKERMIAEISRAEGVMMTMYALIRDMGIANMVEEDKDGKLGNVLGDTIHGLNYIIEMVEEEEDDGADADREDRADED